MRSVMRHIISIALMIFAIGPMIGHSAEADISPPFTDFYHAVKSKNMDDIKEFITESSKFGFGGEHGISGFNDVYIKDNYCFKELVTALQQGCKVSKVGGETACFSPPQSTDDSVVYPGARAKFVFIKEKFVVEFAVCGSD